MTDLEIAGASSRLVDVGGVRLNVVEAGAGKLVVLLHGFPEFWGSWRHQIPALAAAGLRVAAPDLRGYHLSDKPARVADYRLEALVEDVAGLIGELGYEKASLVGHDWGGMVAWAFAMWRPQLLERLAILNVPHPRRMLRGLLSPRQLARSWYIAFIQAPGLAERAFAARDFALLRAAWRADGLEPPAVERLVQALRTGGLTGGMNYYRAAARRTARLSPEPIGRVEAPVLILWGERDRYLRRELAEPDPRLVPHARVVRLPDASHWVQQSAPEKVSALLADFLSASALPKDFR